MSFIFAVQPAGWTDTTGFVTWTGICDFLSVFFCCAGGAAQGCSYGDARDTTITRGGDGRWYVALWDYINNQHVTFRTTSINLECPPSGTDADWEFYSSDDSTAYVFIQATCCGSLDTIGTDPILISNWRIQIPAGYGGVVLIPSYVVWDGKLYWDTMSGGWQNTAPVSIPLVGGTTWLDIPLPNGIIVGRSYGTAQLNIGPFQYIGKQGCEEHFYGPIGLRPGSPGSLYGTWGSTMYPVIGPVAP
jgi:hypothetical protein